MLRYIPSMSAFWRVFIINGCWILSKTSWLTLYCCAGDWYVKVAQSCLTFCEHMYYTVHGILQARILEWVAFPFSRGSSQPRDWTQVSHTTGGFFTIWATKEALGIWSLCQIFSHVCSYSLNIDYYGFCIYKFKFQVFYQYFPLHLCFPVIFIKIFCMSSLNYVYFSRIFIIACLHLKFDHTKYF